ncbi:MAG: MFS transporter [Ruminococcaceae bacterium]|nr:MFS transporter [Oscillospiraceae bacterium]
MNKNINRFIKIFPWYSGLTADLLFYIAIDTLFLTIVKNFSAAQIVSLTSFAQLACIALQFLVLFIIKRIGNTASTRVGAICMLISAIIITVGKSYYLVLVGRLFHDVSVIFKTASFVALENNLDLVGKRSDFVRLRASANTIYAVLTMLISFVASYMFNLYHYLPMIGCITACAIGVILTFLMKDCSDYNKITYKKENKEKVKIHYSKFIIMTIVVYSFFYPIVNNGQTDGKLFIQQQILLDFNVDTTALIIGAIVCVSRIIRVFSNVIFAKLYYKYQGKLGIALPVMLSCSIALMLFGSLIPQIIVKIIVMGIGYTIILFARDPFKLYMQDVVFENTPKEQHQTLLTMLEFGVKLTTAGFGLGFSAILINYPMIVVMALMLVISTIDIVLSIKLYKMVLIKKTDVRYR